MSSSLFNTLGTLGMMMGNNNMTNLLQQFNQFRSTYTGGNPKQQVQSLLQSGQMSQAQFQQFAQMANQLRGMIK